MSLDEPEPVDSVLTFPSGYDTLEYSSVKAKAVSVRLRILFVTLQNTNSVIGEVTDTEKTSSCRASVNYCSIGLRGLSRRGSEATNGIISLPAMAGGLWDADGV